MNIWRWLAITFSLCCLGAWTYGDTYTWDGGGVDGDWSTIENWNPDGLPSDLGDWDSFVFGGTMQLGSNNDIGGDFGGWNVNTIEFASGAGSFTLTDNGDGFDMLGATSAGAADGPAVVTNNSTSLQTIDVDLVHRSDFNTELVFDAASGDLTISGDITGGADNRPVTINGGADKVVTFGGNNSYAGQTVVNRILRLTSATGLGATSEGTTVNSGRRLLLAGGLIVSGETVTINGNGGNYFGALQNEAGANTWNGPVIIGSDYARIGADTGTLTISGSIGDSASGNDILFRNNTNGVTVVSGTNAYTGNTQISGGTTQLAGGDNRLLTSTVLEMGLSNLSGTFDLNGQNQEVSRLVVAQTSGTDSNVVTSVSSPATLTVKYPSSSDYEYGGKLSGLLGLTKAGPGVLTLSGINDHTGLTTVEGGVIRITNANALGTTAGGSVVANGARLELPGGVTVTGETLTINGDGGNFYGALQNQAGDNTWAGPVLIGSNYARIGNRSGILRVSGPIGDGAANNLRIRNFTDRLTILSGASNYTGNTQIVGGFTRLTSGTNRLPTSTVLEMGLATVSGNLDLFGQDQEVAGITVTGGTNNVIRSSAGPSVLTVNNVDDYTYADLLTGDLTLVKTNAGTLTLDGDNTYSGGTTVSNGTLLINGHHTGVGLVDVLAGATLGGGGTIDGIVQIAGLHSPGNSPEQQDFGSDLDYLNGASIDWELIDNTTAGLGVNFDHVTVGGNLSFGAPVSLNLVFNAATGSTVDWQDSFWASDHTGVAGGWHLYDVDGTTNLGGLQLVSIDWADSFGDTLGTHWDGAAFGLSQVGNDVYLNFTAGTAIPEPSTWAVFALLMTGLFTAAKRHRGNAA